MHIFDDQLIVITGGAGFIGSCVVRELNNCGLTNIVIVDHMGQGDKWKNLVGKRIMDYIPKQELFQWLQGKESLIEAFIHLGACSSTVETDVDYLMSNNFDYSKRLVDYAITHGQRFIYASSAATYGDGLQGFIDNDANDAINALKALNAYAFSKQLFDLWLLNQGVLNRVAGLKYFNVFGPNEWHKGRMASVVYHVAPKAQKEGVIRLFKSNDPQHFSDGGQMRDFIYVKDAARMSCAFLKNDACGIYNIGSGRAETWNEMAKAIFKALNLPENIEYIPMPEDLIGKYQNYTCADMEKTVRVLGEAAECRPLEESIVDYVRNYLITGERW